MVCDGMGGHEHGEVASQLVCETLSNYLKGNVPSCPGWKDCPNWILRIQPTFFLVIISLEGSDEEKRQILIQTSKSSADNHSAYLIHIVSVEGETDDHRFLNDEGNVRSNALLLEKDGVNKNQTSSPTLFHRIISIFCKRHHSL